VAVAVAVMVVMMFRGGTPSDTRADDTTRAVARRPAKPAPVAPPADESEAATDGGSLDAQNASARNTPPAPAPKASAPAAAPPPALDAAPAAARKDKVVDLMPMIDPSIAAVAGSWRFENGDLVSNDGKPATLQIPYTPPAEYDVRIEFTAASTVQVHLFKDPASFSWAMGNSHDAGFEYVDGKHVWESPFKSSFRVTPGKRHTSVIRVRNNRVQGYIDGQLLVDAMTDYENFSKNPELSQPDNSRLGIGSYNLPARFHKIEVVEITR
jgi:hypothetical protein